jgi:hypothetical protein
MSELALLGFAAFGETNPGATGVRQIGYSQFSRRGDGQLNVRTYKPHRRLLNGAVVAAQT